MTEAGEDSRETDEVESQHDREAKDNGDRPFIPDEDAGKTDADEYSRDEKDHGRQDHGP